MRPAVLSSCCPNYWMTFPLKSTLLPMAGFFAVQLPPLPRDCKLLRIVVHPGQGRRGLKRIVQPRPQIAIEEQLLPQQCGQCRQRPGLTAGIMYGVPPFGYNYLSPAPPLFATPFITAANGAENTDPFPLNFPPHNVSAQSPFNAFNWPAVTPIAADPYFYYRNSVPYTENYMFSLQRQIAGSALLTVSYAGNEGHHLLVLVPTNIGNPALCLSLSQPNEVAPGTATCGPFGEDAEYTSASGKVYQGTRVGLGPNYGSMTAQKSVGNSAITLWKPP